MITAMLAGPTPLAGAQGGDEIDSRLAAKGESTRTVDGDAFAGTLQMGSTGRAVVKLQQALGVPADGVFGARTEAAVREYQQNNGLAVDGVVGPETWGSLFGAGTAGASFDVPQAPPDAVQFRVRKASKSERETVASKADNHTRSGKGDVVAVELRTNSKPDRGRRNGNAPSGSGDSQPVSNAPSGPVSHDCGSGTVIRPVKGTVTGVFGEDRGSHRHSGLDIAAPSGTPIRAAACGVITTLGSQGGYGNIVCIKHSSNFTTCYAHLSRFSAHMGQRVHQGEIIGYVGCTGSCTGPHVHFETRVNGSAQDPQRYLSGGRKFKGSASSDERRAKAASGGSGGSTASQSEPTATTATPEGATPMPASSPPASSYEQNYRPAPSAQPAPAPAPTQPAAPAQPYQAPAPAPVTEPAAPVEPVDPAPVEPVTEAPAAPAPVEEAPPVDTPPVDTPPVDVPAEVEQAAPPAEAAPAAAPAAEPAEVPAASTG